MPTFFQRVEKWIHTAGEWPYLPFFLFVWTLVDYYTLLLPADAVFAAAIIGCPRRIYAFSAAVILARAVGTVGLFHIAQTIPMDQMIVAAQDLGLGDGLRNSRFFFERFGPPSLSFIAALPFPPLQFVVLLSASAGASLWALELYLIPGLILKCLSIYFAVKGGELLVRKSKRGRKTAAPPARSAGRQRLS